MAMDKRKLYLKFTLLTLTIILSVFFMISQNKDNLLIPRKILFGNPDIVHVQISPNGQYVAWLAPFEGVMNVHVAPITEIDNFRVITKDKIRGISSYSWTYDDLNILYFQDDKGDENHHLHIVNIQKLEDVDLTNFQDTKALLVAYNRFNPDKAVVALNKRRKDLFDLYTLNLSDHTLTELLVNDEFSDFVLDDEYHLRFAEKNEAEGTLIYIFDSALNKFSHYMTVPADDIYTTGIVNFNSDGDKLYFIDSVNRDTSALTLMDIETKHKEILYQTAKADISGVAINPVTKELESVSYNHLRVERVFFNKNIEADYNILTEKLGTAEISVVSANLQNDIWVVLSSPADAVGTYYLYRRSDKELTKLFVSRKDLLSYQLAKMYPLSIKSQDGLELVSYLTLPHAVKFNEVAMRADKPVPLILWVHGGPTARDYFGYNSIHQWLSNRGYAVLSVNYRGSTGFGKNFINAGNGEWSKKAHTDLIDAANWAIEHNITTENQIAIGGGSYGGYAALVGLTFTPDFFQCAVDIVGPSNLVTLLETIPPYWKPALVSLERKVGGNLRTEEGRQELMQRSPINFIDNIKKPLLIGHGANDPRVKQSESDQIVSLMEEKNVPVTYILYPDEGHGFVRPENRMSFFAFMELFLTNHLGGRFEDIVNDLENSSFQIKVGEKHLTRNDQQIRK